MTLRLDGKGAAAYFTYDALGRQIAARYAGVEPVYFEYDETGNRTVMLDQWGTTSWTYDALSRQGRPKAEIGMVCLELTRRQE